MPAMINAHSKKYDAVMCVQAGWLILKSFPEHVDVLAFMNAVDVLRRKLCVRLMSSLSWVFQ